MTECHSLGQQGEDLAVAHLVESGYKILHRNWITGKHEIDIIAENADFIVFIEVKTRTADYLVHPRDAVSVQKQKSMVLCADTYIKRYKINKECRFDIISVLTDKSNSEIEHLTDAFYPTLK
jgi:putative endonuclease